MQRMLRSLLKERFALVVHDETRELPVGYLVMAGFRTLPFPAGPS